MLATTMGWACSCSLSISGSPISVVLYTSQDFTLLSFITDICIDNFTICSREEDLQFSWIRIECELRNNPADNNTFSLAQVALDGLLNFSMVQAFIVSQSTALSGMYRHVEACIEWNLTCKWLSSSPNTIEFGFCDAELTSGVFSNYSWPEVAAGTTATLPCELGPMVPNGMARRTCNPDTAEWEPVTLDECFTSEFCPFNHRKLSIPCVIIIFTFDVQLLWLNGRKTP